MFKKVSLVFFSVLWFCSICLFVYRLTEPEATAEISNQMISTMSISSTENPVLNTEDSYNQIKYFFFCTVDHQDCSYMNDTILKTLAAEVNVEQFSFLEFVDVEALYGDWTPSKLKSVWGFENYPALVAAKDLGNSFEILNAIEWSDETPLDTQSVKQWMIQNELWTGAVEEQAEIIDKPLDEQ